MRGVGGVADRDPAAGEGTGAAPYPSAGSNPAPSTTDEQMRQRAADFYGYPNPDNLPDGAYERWERSFAGAAAGLRFALDDAGAALWDARPRWWPRWIYWPGQVKAEKGNRASDG